MHKRAIAIALLTPLLYALWAIIAAASIHFEWRVFSQVSWMLGMLYLLFALTTVILRAAGRRAAIITVGVLVVVGVIGAVEITSGDPGSIPLWLLTPGGAWFGALSAAICAALGWKIPTGLPYDYDPWEKNGYDPWKDLWEKKKR
jgi:hypothetical protein